MVVDDDGAVGKFGVGVPTVGEKRSQWRIAPSEPPETRIGCAGFHVGLLHGKVSTCQQRIDEVLGLKEEDETDIQQTSFLCPRRTTQSLRERISNICTIGSRDALASRSPCGELTLALVSYSHVDV